MPIGLVLTYIRGNIMNEKVKICIDKFSELSWQKRVRKNKETVLLIAELLYTARKYLNSGEWYEFISEIRATPTYVSKMITIHKNKDLLDGVLLEYGYELTENTRRSYTNYYEIAKKANNMLEVEFSNVTGTYVEYYKQKNIIKDRPQLAPEIVGKKQSNLLMRVIKHFGVA